ncbi:sensor histidine kinase [Moheibacter sediminis]|uniref:sensor histidine kinase n=1 Tax=Moheibacter sediminis TaxID=1434700 RepID=UPI0013562DE7|nr:histidine kinase [Moheibacter sediminis]
MKNISSEIHDNIGQILSTISIYSHTLFRAAPEDLKPKIVESQDLVEKAIVEVRALSKALNTDYVKNIGLLDSIQLEMQRLTRLKLLNAKLEIIGKPYRLNEETELIILRILQEFISNTLKHAKATQLNMDFEYTSKEFRIKAQDNGIGFEGNKYTGTGLINMKNRAKVIGAAINFESQLNHGAQLNLSYQNKQTN